MLGATVGKASALKMCFAAYTKGTVALLSAILATAESLGVRDALLEQWRHDDPVRIQRREAALSVRSMSLCASTGG